MIPLLPVTKTEAIKALLECDWLEQACRNIGKSEWEELRQEFWAKMLEHPESVFTNIRNLQFFCVRVIINTNTDRLRKVRPTVHDSPEIADDPQMDMQVAIHNAISHKDAIIGKLPMYERVIFKLHERGVSCRKISEFTKINRTEVNDTVNRVKKHIQANVRYQP